jgi:hypothetical protein
MSRMLALLIALIVAAVPATATLPGVTEPVDMRATTNPIATDETSYQVFARVFSDPHGCLVHGEDPPTGDDAFISPWAKGRGCATDYLSYAEVLAGAKFLAQRFPDLFEVIRLDNAYDNPEYVSAGIAKVTANEDGEQKVLGRDRSPLYLFKVTDAESDVPESERLHFAYSLSIHGLERAGLEGGVRAMEDLVTWAACEKEDYVDNTPACGLEGPFPKSIVESDTERPVPTAGEALRSTVSYFFMPNPDGWRNGQKSDAVELRDGNVNTNYTPGVTFARGNGNGVDLNRDWPNVGYTQKSHQPWSEPETKAYGDALLDIRDRTANRKFAGGIDLHGMLTASAFSYTLLGADQRNYHKNQLTVETSLRTWEDQTARLTWSPYIGDGDGDGVSDRPAPIPVADQWGTIYDTLGYTVTGALGNWMDDSRLGLGGVGINNEMALSNLAPDTVYEPGLNQTHIDGNKGLIYSQISALMYEQRSTYVPGGKIGYVFNPERIRDKGGSRPANPGLNAQEDFELLLPCQGEAQQQLPGNCGPGTYSTNGSTSYYEFDVLGPADGVHNGGMTVTSTRLGTEQGGNVPTVHAGVVLERWDTDHAYGGKWIVEKDLARTAVSLNDPAPGRWRVSFSHTTGFPRRLAVDFDAVQAEEDPGQLPIDVSSMDFFTELNEWVPEGSELEAVSIDKVVAGDGLDAFDSLIVVNNLGDRHYLTSQHGLAGDEAAAYFANLDAFASGGGNLVLTDAALQALPELGVVGRGDVTVSEGLAGFYGFRTGADTITYQDPDSYPLAREVDQPGAAEQTLGNRQAVEPTTLGFNPNSGGGHSRMPFWGVDRAAWEAKCDKAEQTLCTTAATSAQGSKVSLGEVGHGDGTIRIVGIMLPDPLRTDDEIADNRFGLGSYALTYTAYTVFENLVDYRRGE